MPDNLLITNLRYLLLVLALGGSSAFLTAQSAHNALRKGNRAYEEQRFEEAEQNYQKALEAENSAKGNYNLGNALYEKGQFPEAAKRYEEAASLADNDNIKSDAYRNLGDAYFQQKEYQKSVEAYKNSLRIRPDDQETKYNLSKALRQIQQQQEQQNQQNQQQQEKEQQNQEQQEQEGQGQQQQEQNQGQEGQGQQQQEQNQAPTPNTQDGQPSQAEPGKTPKMSREEAERQLGIAAEAEKKTMTRLQRDTQNACNSKEEW